MCSPVLSGRIIADVNFLNICLLWWFPVMLSICKTEMIWAHSFFVNSVSISSINSLMLYSMKGGRPKFPGANDHYDDKQGRPEGVKIFYIL